MVDVFFRLDVGENIGVGHFVRCLALANVLYDLGRRAGFIVSETHDFIESELSGLDHLLVEIGENSEAEDAEKTIQILQAHRCKNMVMDHYGLSETWELMVGKQSKIVVFEDQPNREHKANYLIDGTPGRERSEYESLVESDCNLLLSSNYLVIRREFLNNRENSIRRRKECSDLSCILISFGGSDVDNLSGKVVEYLRNNGYSNEIVVVTTSINSNIPQLKSICDQNQSTLVVNPTDMAGLMTKADLMIGALGSTTWERGVLGIPSIAIQVADNQQAIKQLLGDVEGCDVADDQAHLFTLISKRLVPLDVKEFGRDIDSVSALCDGLGAYRIALRVFVQDFSLLLSPFTVDDSDTLFQWQNEPQARQYARTPRPPSHLEHCKWVESSMNNSSRRMWLLNLLDQKCGYVRLDENQLDKTEEVSILISSRFSGLGIGKKAIEVLQDKAKYGHLTAEVDPANLPSVSVFLGCGFKPLSDRLYEWRSHEIH